jgi:RHS repeat-associated protein
MELPSARILHSETVYAYAGRVTSITHKNAGGTTIDSYSYQYDSAGRVTQVTSTLAPTENYTYDDNSQLLGDGTNTFSFDANGNRTMSGYTVSAGNRITSDGTYSYTWDDEGNLATKSKSGEYWVYAWDVGNRLVDVKEYNSQGGTLLKEVKFGYDVFNNEIQKDLDTSGGGTFVTTKYAYDQNHNGFVDLDNSGSLTTRRLYANAVDALFARIGASGNEDWFLQDRLGSNRDIVNSSGTLLDHIDYNVWGEITSETSPSNGDPRGFTSKPTDKDIGFQNNTNRWYITHLGIFASQDPTGFSAGDANLGRYVGNNPTNATDPTGLEEFHGGVAALRGAATSAMEQAPINVPPGTLVFHVPHPSNNYYRPAQPSRPADQWGGYFFTADGDNVYVTFNGVVPLPGVLPLSGHDPEDNGMSAAQLGGALQAVGGGILMGIAMVYVNPWLAAVAADQLVTGFESMRRDRPVENLLHRGLREGFRALGAQHPSRMADVAEFMLALRAGWNPWAPQAAARVGPVRVAADLTRVPSVCC